jgi:signal peptidase I
MKVILEWVKPIVIAVIIAVVINSFIIVNAIIPTGSMEDTIQVNDRLFAFRLSYLLSQPERGDIIIFDSNYEDKLLVKRIIGLPGETIEIKDNQVLVDGVVIDESYVKEDIRGDFGPYSVPEDSYFMLGDNRNGSHDSRKWDNPYITKDAIKGKAFLKYYPSLEILWR